MDAVNAPRFLLGFVAAYAAGVAGTRPLDFEHHDKLVVCLGYRFVVENWHDLTPTVQQVLECIQEDCGSDLAQRIHHEICAFLGTIRAGSVDDVFSAASLLASALTEPMVEGLKQEKKHQGFFRYSSDSVLGSFLNGMLQKLIATDFQGLTYLWKSLMNYQTDGNTQSEGNCSPEFSEQGYTKRHLGELLTQYLEQFREDRSSATFQNQPESWERLHSLVAQAPSDLPNSHLARLAIALRNEDYSSAVDAIHSYYDFPIDGAALSTGGAFKRIGGGTFDPSFRSKFSSDYHYCLIHIASIQLWFGYLGGAEESLVSGIISAQLRGDEVGATIAMTFLAQLQHDAWKSRLSNEISDSHEKTLNGLFFPFPTFATVSSQTSKSLLRRCRQRACELGLCRLHVLFAKTIGREEPLKFSIRSWRYGDISRSKDRGDHISIVKLDSPAFDDVSCCTQFALDCRLPTTVRHAESQMSTKGLEELVQYNAYTSRGRHHIGLPMHANASSLLKKVVFATLSVSHSTTDSLSWQLLPHLSKSSAQMFPINMDAIQRLQTLVENDNDDIEEIVLRSSSGWRSPSSAQAKVYAFKRIFEDSDLNYDFASIRLRIKAGLAFVECLLEELEGLSDLDNAAEANAVGMQHEITPVLSEISNIAEELSISDLSIQCLLLKAKTLFSLPHSLVQGMDLLRSHFSEIYCYGDSSTVRQAIELLYFGEAEILSAEPPTERRDHFRSFETSMAELLKRDASLDGTLAQEVPQLTYDDIFGDSL